MNDIIYKIGEAVFTEIEEINEIDYCVEENEISLTFNNGKILKLYLMTYNPYVL